jgi:hypothetical protein
LDALYGGLELKHKDLGMLCFDADTLRDDLAVGHDAQIEGGYWLGLGNGLVDVPLLDFVDTFQIGGGLVI